MTVVTDNFNRANETPLAAPWTKVGGLNVNLSSNQISSGGGTDTIYYYTSSASGADQYAEFSYAAVTGDDWGPAVRVNGGGHAAPILEAYSYDITSGGGIIRHFNGSGSVIASSSPAHVIGDVVRIEASGQVIKGFLNGAQQVSFTDSSASQLSGAGNGVGFFAFAINAGDNFNGGDLGAAGAAATIVGSLTTPPFRWTTRPRAR